VGSNRQGRLLFGVEVEFGFSASDERGQQLSPDDILTRYLDLCAERLEYLPSHGGSRMYLANGALIYPDVGHPEYATG